jgi:HSP20 family molecular chaperone IbpA
MGRTKTFPPFAIRFNVTVEIALYLGEAKLSTKWRRSKKYLKWLDLKNQEVSDGKNQPKISRARNMRATSAAYHQKYRYFKNYDKRAWKEPKPLIDIFQENSWITIIAQIAGFNKETLKIEVKDQKLTLSAKAKDRKYYKSLNLPKVVIPNVMYTTYKNGVLEIKLKKAQTPNQEAE